VWYSFGVAARRWWVPTAVAALVVLAIALKPALSASGASTGPWIVFSAHPDGTALQQLFRIQSTGEGLQQISTGDRPATDPAFSPDGSRIVFVRLGTGIFSANLDGTNEKRLTSNGRDSFPAWSPNGKQIAFLRPYRKQWTVHVMSASGAGQHRLPLAPPGGRVSWAANSRSLFVPTVADVSKIDAKTGRVQGRFDLRAELVSSTAAAVAPDGRSVAYIGRRPLTGPPDCGESPCPMFALYLTSTTRRKPVKIANGTGPASWLPDGKTLIYVTGGNLRVTRPGGKSSTIELDSHLAAGDSAPAWQPR
jgi:Tol biopolymer transport system component